MRVLPVLMLMLLLMGCTSPKAPVSTEAAVSLPALTEEPEAAWGVEILAGEDAVKIQPWDYGFTPETREELQSAQISLLQSCLDRYPAGMLEALSRDCGGLTICLVREIYGKEDKSGVQHPVGLQFRDPQGGTYIILTQDLEYTLYHELFHVMEDFAVLRTDVWEDWNSLNPPDFSYDLDFEQNALRGDSPYLQDGSRYFIDTYSMSFPREDRARIMEYAMTEGNAHLFKDPPMQEKLSLLSLGIRQAFGLRSEDLPWEQYLK